MNARTAEVVLVAGADAEGPRVVGCATGDVVLCTRRSPLRERNEDALLVVARADATLIAVADGMGGLNAGDVASRLTLERVAERFVSVPADEGDALRHAVVDGLQAANGELLVSGLGAGTTFACTIVTRDRTRAIHVGDSEALQVGQRGLLKARTLPHSPVGYAVEAGLIDEVEAMVHEDRHLLTNHVGMEAMRIELGPELPLASRDRVLVATDGLLDNLLVDEVVEIVRRGDPVRAAARLVREASLRMPSPRGEPGKPDDLSFVLHAPTSAATRAARAPR